MALPSSHPLTRPSLLRTPSRLSARVVYIQPRIQPARTRCPTPPPVCRCHWHRHCSHIRPSRQPVVRTCAAWIFTGEPQLGEPRCTSLTGGLMADEKEANFTHLQPHRVRHQSAILTRLPPKSVSGRNSPAGTHAQRLSSPTNCMWPTGGFSLVHPPSRTRMTGWMAGDTTSLPCGSGTTLSSAIVSWCPGPRDEGTHKDLPGSSGPAHQPSLFLLPDTCECAGPNIDD